MAWSAEERDAAEALADLAYANPFGQHRELTHRALGDEATQPGTPNDALEVRAAALLERVVVDRDEAPNTSVVLGLIRHRLGARLRELFDSLSQACAAGTLTRRRVSSFRLFDEEVRRIAVAALDDEPSPAHMFAVMFQEHRAEKMIAEAVPGGSDAAVALRRAAWESVFTRDRRRYEQTLFARMAALPVLVVGPAGSCQDAIAAAIAGAALVPFDADTLRFEAEAATQAVDARWAHDSVTRALFGTTSGLSHAGCVVLRRVEELALATQAQLAAALQTGSFVPDDASEPVALAARVIASAQGDIERAVASGQVRRDLWDALAVDVIETTPLRERLQGEASDLAELVRQALAPLLDDAMLDHTTTDVIAWLEHNRSDYAWPGDLAELVRTARAALVREPAPTASPAHTATERLAAAFAHAELDMDRMLEAYCTLAYAAAGSYQDAARRLGVDRRTVKARVDQALLSELQRERKGEDA
jgi:hypothetical protein